MLYISQVEDEKRQNKIKQKQIRVRVDSFCVYLKVADTGSVQVVKSKQKLHKLKTVRISVALTLI